MIIGISGNGTPKSLSIPIIIVAIALVVVIDIVIGLSLDNSDEPQRPEAPSSLQPTSPNSTPPSSASSTSMSKTTTTMTTALESSETSSNASSMSSTLISSSSPTPGTAPPSSTMTGSEPTSAPGGQDFDTRRSGLDGLGFVGNSARCDNDDCILAIIIAEQGIKATACEARSGEKYYRSDTPQGSGSMDVVVDEDDRVVAQSGSYKYQMSPDGVLVTKDSEVIKKYAVETWGTV